MAFRQCPKSIVYIAITIMKKLPIFLIPLFLLMGCAATGHKFTQFESVDEDESILYIYRTSSFFGGGLTPTVFIDKEKKAKLKNGGYQVYSLLPGMHLIELEGNIFEWPGRNFQLKMQFERGGTTFLRLWGKAGVGHIYFEFQPVEEYFGRNDILQLKLSQ